MNDIDIKENLKKIISIPEINCINLEFETINIRLHLNKSEYDKIVLNL